MREEWQHCIANSKGFAICAERGSAYRLANEWHFVDLEHAKRSVEQQTREQRCPECWKIANCPHANCETLYDTTTCPDCGESWLDE